MSVDDLVNEKHLMCINSVNWEEIYNYNLKFMASKCCNKSKKKNAINSDDGIVNDDSNLDNLDVKEEKININMAEEMSFKCIDNLKSNLL